MPLTVIKKQLLEKGSEDIAKMSAVLMSDGSIALQILDVGSGGSGGGTDVNVHDGAGTAIDSVTAGGKKRLCVDAVLDVGDIEIGAVELKDGASDQRATITALGQLLVAQGKIAGEDLVNDLMKVAPALSVLVFSLKINNPVGVTLIKAPGAGTKMKLHHYYIKSDVPSGDITLEFTTAGVPSKVIGINNLQATEPWSHTTAQGFIDAPNADDDLRIDVNLVGNVYVNIEYTEV